MTGLVCTTPLLSWGAVSPEPKFGVTGIVSMGTIWNALWPGPVSAENVVQPGLSKLSSSFSEMTSHHLSGGTGRVATAGWLLPCRASYWDNGLPEAPTKTHHIQERGGFAVTVTMQIRGRVYVSLNEASLSWYT